MPRRTHPRIARHRPRFAVERLEGRALLAIAVDASFGINGYAQTTVHGAASVVVPLADGEILVGGANFSSTAVGDLAYISRLTASGAVERTASIGPGQNGSDFFTDVSAMAVEPDGKILVVGDGLPEGSANSPDTIFAVARLNADLTPDTSFGTDGVESFPITPGVLPASPDAVAIQPDGKILVAGRVGTPAAAGQPAGLTSYVLIRLDANGALDAGFATGGVLIGTVTPGNSYDAATALAVTPSGRILLGVGETIYEADLGTQDPVTKPYLLGLKSDGSADSAFNGGAPVPLTVAPPVSGDVDAIHVQADGKIVAAGSLYTILTHPGFIQYEFFSAARLNSDGTFDPSYGSGGRALVTDLGTTRNVVPAFAPDGDVVFAGGAPPGSPDGSTVVRLNADGTVADGSGTGGKTVVSAAISVGGLAVQSDGKILIAGAPNDSGPGGVLRLNADSAPGDFDGDGKSDYVVDVLAYGAFIVRSSSTGSYSIESFGPSSDQIVPVAGDFDGDGKADLAIDESSTGFFAYRPSGGGPDVIRTSDLAGAIAVPGDYAGSGQSDPAVFYPQYGIFADLPPQADGQTAVPFGIPGISLPSVGDFDGSGRTELGFYVPESSTFVYQPSASSTPAVVPFGPTGVGFTPAIGDYDGDGKSDLALYSSQYSVFLYKPSSGGAPVAVQLGPPDTGFVAVPGDYDGDGKTDLAVYNPQYGLFIYRPSSGGPDIVIQSAPPDNQALDVLTAGSGSDLLTPSIRTESVGAGGLAQAEVIGSLDLVEPPTNAGSTPISPKKAPVPML